MESVLAGQYPQLVSISAHSKISEQGSAPSWIPGAAALAALSFAGAQRLHTEQPQWGVLVVL